MADQLSTVESVVARDVRLRPMGLVRWPEGADAPTLPRMRSTARMKLPWVSRRAFEQVVAERDRLVLYHEPRVSDEAYRAIQNERDRLRQQNDQLIDHLARLTRREAGLPEVPREARKPLEPMPADLRQYIDGYASPSIRKQMRDEALRRHARGEAWDAILPDMMRTEAPYGQPQ